ncbi:MAG: hypothetical protein QW719_01900 [Candidatus Micrarchaeaceae archaeon]
MLNELLNKDVVVVMKDGFKKIGKLSGIDGKMIALKFYDGRTEMINIDDISKISEMNKV